MKDIKKITWALTAIAAMSIATSAVAEMSAPMGWYLEGNVGKSRISSVSYAANTSVNSSGSGWNLTAGYKFIPYFAAEIGYTSYANGSINFNGSKVGENQAQAYDAVGKAILPIQDTGADVFAKLGIARAKAHVTSTNAALLAANGESLTTGRFTSNNLYVGLGADYTFMPNTAVNLQWNRVDGSSKIGNLDLLSVGLTYLFG